MSDPLLILILCVLLFGAGAVLKVIKWGCLVPLFIVFVVLPAAYIVLFAGVISFSSLNEYMKDVTRPATKEQLRPVPAPVVPAVPERTEVADAVSKDCQVISVRMAKNVFSAVQREALYKECVVRSMTANNKY